MANKDFDIKRAYEKWVEQGQPVDSDSKKESRKYAGKNNDHRSKGQEVKNGDRRSKGQEVKNGDRRAKGHEAKSSDRRPSKDRVTAGGIKSSPRPADEEKQYRPKFVADPDAPARAVAQEPPEAVPVLRGGDDEDVATFDESEGF